MNYKIKISDHGTLKGVPLAFVEILHDNNTVGYAMVTVNEIVRVSAEDPYTEKNIWSAVEQHEQVIDNFLRRNA